MIDGLTIVWLSMFIVNLVLAIVLNIWKGNVHAIWFIPASVITAVVSIVAPKEIGLQVLVFAVVSIAMYFIFRTRWIATKRTRTNLAALIGERCLVVEDISNINVKGLVNLKGSIWSARSVDENDYIEQGTIVVVEKVDGVKLVCKREI